MAVTVERREDGWTIRVESDFTLSSAAELKSLLLAGLLEAKQLELDLSGAPEIDIPLWQLVWAAGRQAASQGHEIIGRMPEVLARAWREAGFEPPPGIRDAGASGGSDG